MKEYEKPELELVDFATEVVTFAGGEGGGEVNPSGEGGMEWD